MTRFTITQEIGHIRILPVLCKVIPLLYCSHLLLLHLPYVRRDGPGESEAGPDISWDPGYGEIWLVKR